ncbi:MAG: Ig-like domain-containing protein, partial [Balneolaceae bacterium]
MILFILKSCATPMGPTGGEPDRSAPIVINTDPQQGSTNFSDREVSFTFDKYIDRNSFRQNVSIEPDLGIEFETSFRRKTATVRFASELPENTTVIVKVGTDVTDTNRNRLDSSYDLALSTGDVLDRGKITATAIDAETGRGESGQRIFLYREPFDLES